MTPVITAAGKSGMPSSSLMPTAAPRNSARSVAIAISSAWTQRPIEVRREYCSRQTSGRLRPVAMPSFAESVWISIAIRLEATMTQTKRVAELRAAGDVRREVARIDVGDAGDERRPEEGQERPAAAAQRARPPAAGAAISASTRVAIIPPRSLA